MDHVPVVLRFRDGRLSAGRSFRNSMWSIRPSVGQRRQVRCADPFTDLKAVFFPKTAGLPAGPNGEEGSVLAVEFPTER